jgi:hypothetical protein
MLPATRVALALALLLGAGCAKKNKQEPAQEIVPAMSADEVKRSEDACKVYVERACACPAAAEQCRLAKAQPDAVRIGLEVAANPESKPDIVRQAYASVRKTVKECIEQTAKLPTLGCNSAPL